MMSNAQSFCAGYRAVRTGRVRHELTAREIETMFPRHDCSAFAQGMIDGLAGDSFRYRLARDALRSSGCLLVCNEDGWQ